MEENLRKSRKMIENASIKATTWIGSTRSLVFHTIVFIVVLLLPFFGVSFDKVLLILTTIVSLEAIYLSIFIQMTVNRHAEELVEVSEDIEEIQEDVEKIERDIDEIQEDVEEIEEDTDTESEEKKRLIHDLELLSKIENSLNELRDDIKTLKGK